jgi:serine O-acetyltransferase
MTNWPSTFLKEKLTGEAPDASLPRVRAPEGSRAGKPNEPTSGMQTLIRIHKLSRRLFDRRWFGLSRSIDRVIRLVYAARIPAEADIHPTVHFSHNALAVVVTKKAFIGPHCHIGMHVLLGSRWPLDGGPRLEEKVIVHAGAKIIGPVTIGRGSVIGANAVVLEDIPPYSLAVGVPAVVKKTGIRVEEYLPPVAAED